MRKTFIHLTALFLLALSLTACNRTNLRQNWTAPAESNSSENSSSAPAEDTALSDDFDDLDTLFDDLDQILNETETNVEVP